MTEVQVWISVLSPLLTFILAGAGWYFVYFNTNRIAKRAEVFSLVGKAVDKAVALDRRCADYWLADQASRDSTQAWIAGTTSEIYGMRALFELLEKYHGFKGKDNLLVDARQAATLDAEEVARLDVSKLYERRGEQIEALHNILRSLYSYYRVEHD